MGSGLEAMELDPGKKTEILAKYQDCRKLLSYSLIALLLTNTVHFV